MDLAVTVVIGLEISKKKNAYDNVISKSHTVSIMKKFIGIMKLRYYAIEQRLYFSSVTLTERLSLTYNSCSYKTLLVSPMQHRINSGDSN